MSGWRSTAKHGSQHWNVTILTWVIDIKVYIVHHATACLEEPCRQVTWRDFSLDLMLIAIAQHLLTCDVATTMWAGCSECVWVSKIKLPDCFWLHSYSSVNFSMLQVMVKLRRVWKRGYSYGINGCVYHDWVGMLWAKISKHAEISPLPSWVSSTHAHA